MARRFQQLDDAQRVFGNVDRLHERHCNALTNSKPHDAATQRAQDMSTFSSSDETKPFSCESIRRFMRYPTIKRQLFRVLTSQLPHACQKTKKLTAAIQKERNTLPYRLFDGLVPSENEIVDNTPY